MLHYDVAKRSAKIRDTINKILKERFLVQWIQKYRIPTKSNYSKENFQQKGVMSNRQKTISGILRDTFQNKKK